MVIVCGTGAAVGARCRDALWHSSFWQEPTGGFELGERALRAVYRAELGLAPSTLLTDTLLEYLGCTSVEALLHQRTARSNRINKQYKGLSRLLLDVAALGDTVALNEVHRTAAILSDYAWVAARKVGLNGEPFPVVLAGGVMRHESGLLQNAIARYTAKKLPRSACQLTPFEPVVGAIMLALESCNQALIDEQSLMASLPAAEFFAT